MIEAVQSPIVNAYVKAVRFRLMVTLDEAVPCQRSHRTFKRELIADQLSKPRGSICTLTRTQEFVPDILMIKVCKEGQKLCGLWVLLFDLTQRQVPRRIECTSRIIW
jgi:hypothetical protein